MVVRRPVPSAVPQTTLPNVPAMPDRINRAPHSVTRPPDPWSATQGTYTLLDRIPHPGCARWDGDARQPLRCRECFCR